MCIFACGVTPDFEVFVELVDLHSMQDQTEGSHFIQALLCNLQKHDLELSKLPDIVTDGAPSMIGSKMGWYLYFTNICTMYISRMSVSSMPIHQQNLTGETLRFKQVTTSRQ
jgi:hypothetical protein